MPVPPADNHTPQVQVQVSPTDALHEYRIAKLEEAVSSLSTSMSEIAQTVKGARWATALIFGVLQPVGIAVLIHYLTKG